eukprot:scaffold2352_cov153-Ochromonas_danica.AAC.8
MSENERQSKGRELSKQRFSASQVSPLLGGCAVNAHRQARDVAAIRIAFDLSECFRRLAEGIGVLDGATSVLDGLSVAQLRRGTTAQRNPGLHIDGQVVDGLGQSSHLLQAWDCLEGEGVCAAGHVDGQLGRMPCEELLTTLAVASEELASIRQMSSIAANGAGDDLVLVVLANSTERQLGGQANELVCLPPIQAQVLLEPLIGDLIG